MIAANDGLLDGPGSNSDESHLMANCLHQLFRILLSLFAWYAHTHARTHARTHSVLLNCSFTWTFC